MTRVGRIRFRCRALAGAALVALALGGSPVSAETLKELAGKYLLPEKAYIYRVKP